MNLDKINKKMKFLITEEFDKRAYSLWKRRNVSYRGIQGDPYETSENNGGAMLGLGLYTTKDKSFARQYGTLYSVVGGIPQNPKVFDTLNDWQIWFGNTLVPLHAKANGIEKPTSNYFYEHTGVAEELQKMGYDGIVIKGREMVHFNPQDVKYFENERQLEQYYDYVVRHENR